ncbi:MAG: hypothetical protein CEN90_551 [Parcubacteria group bacterium Licking1014_17]|nr:MAG: hypothetical protein CEN90_551 [Parcubacteria group bacterium Licking1014_17]
MPKDSEYKPNLPTDKKYLSDVAKTIKEREPFEKIRFEYLTDALSSLGFSEDPYSLVSLNNLNPGSLKNLVSRSFEKINSAELTGRIKDNLIRLWDYLAEEDKLEKAELIFVFGAFGLQKVDEAIKLWKDGFGSKILSTGQKASYMKDVDVTEAEYYAEIAKKEGVPEDNLILETLAKNTPENAVNSISKLREIGFLPKKIILITLTYHMRRSYLTFKSAAKSVVGWDPVLIRHPVPSVKYTRENYFKDPDGWSYIFFEYIKMYGARLMKHF